MNCKEVQDQLVDYLEARFGNEARRLAEHIESCDECRQEYRDLRETIQLVRRIELKDPGADCWREQRKSIKEAARTAGKPDRAGRGFCDSGRCGFRSSVGLFFQPDIDLPAHWRLPSSSSPGSCMPGKEHSFTPRENIPSCWTRRCSGRYIAAEPFQGDTRRSKNSMS